VSATYAAKPIVRQWIITLACLCAGAGIAATTERGQGDSTCAVRDLSLARAIEKHGAAQDVSPEQLAGAAFTMMRARSACRQGHAAEALIMYDSILFAPRVADSRD
jgi:hypothetical protein